MPAPSARLTSAVSVARLTASPLQAARPHATPAGCPLPLACVVRYSAAAVCQAAVTPQSITCGAAKAKEEDIATMTSFVRVIEFDRP